MENIVAQIDPSKWDAVLKEYDTVLKLKAETLKPEKKKSLLKLDKWYQNELPTVISSRKSRHITHGELCDLMKWKLTRGKFRPRLTEMVQTNSEEAVTEASTRAFEALPDTAAAVQALTVLKAVGPATASAVLAAGAPKHVAFMADESMSALPGMVPIKYDVSQFKSYMKAISGVVKQLNKQDKEKSWTPHKVELTLWTYQLARKLKPELLDTVHQSLTPAENGTSCPKPTEKGTGLQPPTKKAKPSEKDTGLQPARKKAKRSDSSQKKA